MPELPPVHNHVTRDIKQPGVCPGCDVTHRLSQERAANAETLDSAVDRVLAALKAEDLSAEAQRLLTKIVRNEEIGRMCTCGFGGAHLSNNQRCAAFGLEIDTEVYAGFRDWGGE